MADFRADDDSPYPVNGYAGIAQRYDLAKPVIAAVSGVCLGGGFELALSCDMIVASETAVSGLPEPKVGLIAIGGGIHRLVRQIGIKQAMLPLLTGDNIGARRGYEMGFVSEVVDAQQLDGTVAEMCGRIIANAPLAVKLSKELAMWGPEPADAGRCPIRPDRASLVRPLAQLKGCARRAAELRRKASPAMDRPLSAALSPAPCPPACGGPSSSPCPVEPPPRSA